MNEVIRRHVEAALADAPPLSDSQLYAIAKLLRGPRASEPIPGPKPSRQVPKRVALYRHYDNRGCLLYIGITDNFRNRNGQHESGSPWMRFETRVEAEWLPDRKSGEAAERHAIKAERPLFNKNHADSDRNERVVRYLIEHDAIDLLQSSI